MDADSETKLENQSFSNPSFRGPVLFLLVYWYYFVAPLDILKIWGNYLVAAFHYFSIPLLLRTLFSYWHRDIEDYGRGFDFERFMSVFSMNMVSRGVGFIIRSVVIVFGLAAEILLLVGGLVFLIFWLVSPIAVAVLVVFAIKMVF
ncbi:MAG: hypothetical protein Q8N81_04545 [bacterium]|nr:hypothetical protein [bacterium]